MGTTVPVPLQSAPDLPGEEPRQSALVIVQRAVKGHMPALDGIRGVAVILVMVCHFSRLMDLSTPSHGLFNKLTDAGWTGVDLFFVLSGFLITGILLDSKDSPRYFFSFYMRRILRIFPLYYLACFVYLVGLPLIQNHLGILTNLKSLASVRIWFWVYAANWGMAITGKSFGTLGHFWSLAIEEQFYLFWPLAVRYTSNRTLARMCLGATLLSQFLRIVLLLNGFALGTIYIITVTRLDGLLLGALAALAVRNGRWLAQAASSLKYLISCSAVGLIVLAGVCRGFPPDQAPLVTVFSPLLLAVMFAGILLSAIIHSGSHLEEFFRASWLRSCGKYSYAMYVFHLPITLTVEHWIRPYFLKTSANALPDVLHIPAVMVYIIVMSFLTYAVARISWTVMEVHFFNLKRYF
jgi:peptidoglycan/LPS O-acetylase OafA/YrhL